jgi:hypothetical protein
MLGEHKGWNLFVTLKNFRKSFANLIEQMMCQKGFIFIQGNCKKFGIKGMMNLTFYQNLDFFQRLLGHTFYNMVLVCAKVNCNS